MKNRKKVLLFIFEGITEKIALESILEELFSTYDVQVQCIGTDITSDFNIPVALVSTELQNFISNEIKKIHVSLKDIDKIIHVIDTDGGFISPDKVINKNCKSIEYTDENIFTSEVDNIRKRNEEKLAKVNNLVSKSFLFKKDQIPYSVYFFSRKREHAFEGDIQELTNKEKVNKAYAFAEKYNGNEKSFIDFATNSSFSVKGTYEETWNFIKQDSNSLKRYSNFHLIFDDNKD